MHQTDQSKSIKKYPKSTGQNRPRPTIGTKRMTATWDLVLGQFFGLSTAGSRPNFSTKKIYAHSLTLVLIMTGMSPFCLQYSSFFSILTGYNISNFGLVRSLGIRSSHTAAVTWFENTRFSVCYLVAVVTVDVHNAIMYTQQSHNLP
jgi:hypothetical protein